MEELTNEQREYIAGQKDRIENFRPATSNVHSLREIMADIPHPFVSMGAAFSGLNQELPEEQQKANVLQSIHAMDCAGNEFSLSGTGLDGPACPPFSPEEKVGNVGAFAVMGEVDQRALKLGHVNQGEPHVPFTGDVSVVNTGRMTFVNGLLVGIK
jgi:hypothetical protein